MKNKSMFGKNFKYILVLTALAWITYTMPSVRAALDSAYAQGDNYAAAASIFSTTSISNLKAVANGLVPTIKIVATAGDSISATNINVKTDQSLFIYGSPENLKNLKYGKDYTAKIVYPEKLLNCKNNSFAVNPTWIVSCTANYVGGEGKVYLQITRSGRTYTSNVIFVSVKDGTPVSSDITVISPKTGEIISWNQQYNITWGGNWSGSDTFSIIDYNLTLNEKDLVVDNLSQDKAGCPGYGKGVCGYLWTPNIVGKHNLWIIKNPTNSKGDQAYSGEFLVSTSSVSVTPSITLLSPNGGEKIPLGNYFTIKWEPKSIPINGKIRVSLIDHNGILYDNLVVKSGSSCLFQEGEYGRVGECIDANKGYHDVYLESYYTPGKFKIEISCFTATSTYCINQLNGDRSDSLFDIIASPSSPPSSIKVISPNGGETLVRGSNYNLQWKSVGFTDMTLARITATSNGNTVIIADRVIANSNNYNWVVPNDFSIGQYKLSICALLTPETGCASTFDVSDNDFSIN